MSADSQKRAFVVVLLTAVVCSLLVSASVVLLRPLQLANALLERSQNIMSLSGLLPDRALDNEEMLDLFLQLDSRVLDIDSATFIDEMDPDTFDQRRAAASPDSSTPIPSDMDLASLGRRSRYATVYLVWNEGEFDRIILPIRGNGMWSMIYGFLALESDLDTIAAAVFYEQGETPGLGDQITRPDWLGQWQGRRAFNAQGEPAFGIGPGRIDPASAAAAYKVDALAGATVTADAVSNLVHYWLGPHGFGPTLKVLGDASPTQQVRTRSDKVLTEEE